MSTKSRSRGKSIERGINAIFASSWLWGTAITFVFYAGLPYSPVQDELKRYFTSHWVEYLTTDLFFIGVCSLLTRLNRIPHEQSALRADFLGGLAANHEDNALSCAKTIASHLDRVAKRREDTILVKRVRDACAYVIGRRTSDGLGLYLKSLAETGRERLHDAYAQVRTLICAMPILGILGTGISIAMAFGNITADSSDTSFPDVAAGIAVAFDPAALSLVLSLLLFFGTSLIEHSERHTHDEVDDFTMRNVVCLFPTGNSVTASPFTLAEQQAAQQLLVHSEQVINWQMELWQSSLEKLRERWSASLSRQQEALDKALETGLTNALADHSNQLGEVRSEFLAAFQSASQSIGEQLAETRASLTEQQQRGCDQIAHTWQQFRAEITHTRDEHSRQLALLTQVITAEVGAWQTQLESSVQAIGKQFQELRSQGEVFLKLSENESELVRLENRLAENLQSVRVVESFENTLMNLNAAVNLLTTRVKSKAA